MLHAHLASLAMGLDLRTRGFAFAAATILALGFLGLATGPAWCQVI
jgi:hypothetical protein